MFCDFNAVGRAGRDAGAATAAVIQVDLGAGKTADRELERDGAGFTTICAGTAHDAFQCEALIVDLGVIRPGISFDI